MARLEYKYYIPEKYLDSLRRDISPFLLNDKYAEARDKKEYTVRSIYLDSYMMHTYHEKVIGLLNRHKYRIRGYDEQRDDSIVFLEIKRKNYDYITKDRTKILYSNLQPYLQSRCSDLLYGCEEEKKLPGHEVNNFMYYYLLYSLTPTALINYEREAFECRYGTGLRITFDKNIRSRAVNSISELYINERMIPATKGYFVLEVKFHQVIPGWLPTILGNYNVFRDSASKYTMGIDCSYPQKF